MRVPRTATWAALLGVASAALPARAQDLSYEVTPEATRVTAGESFQVVCDILVSGAEIEAISLPETDAFDLVGQSRSEGTQVSIVNGRLSSSRTVRITLTLQARQAGRFEIGPGEVRAGGRVARSDPVAIEANDAAGQPSPPSSAPPPAAAPAPPEVPAPAGQEKLFLVLAVERGEVYLGEQLTATLTLYSRIDLSDIRAIRLPDFEGVVQEDLVTPRRVSPQPTRIGGKRYHAFMLRRVALFPTRAGLLVLPPAEVTAVIGGGFFSRGQLVRRQSEPLEITVKPLPVEERPASFEPGNVGRFGLEVGVNRRRLSQRDPISLTVTVTGRGNFRALTVPRLDQADGFRVFEPTPFEESRAEGGVITGRKGYEVLLQPQRAGELKVPALRLDFFDPSLGRYQTVASDPIAVEVTPWAGAQAGSAVEPATEEAVLPARPVRVAPQLVEARPPLAARSFTALLALLNLGLLALLLCDLALRRRRRSPRTRRQRQLAAVRRELLAAASRGDADACAGALERYLSVALAEPVGGLTREELLRLLQQRGLARQDADQVGILLDTIEARRYAPAGHGGAGELAAPARALVRAVEAAPTEVREEAR